MKVLESESKISLEDESLGRFRQAVLNAQWDEAEVILLKLNIQYEEDIRMVKFEIRQQKYLELLEAGKSKEALVVLKNELATLQRNTPKLHKLATCIVFSTSPGLLRSHMAWEGVDSRSNVLENIRPFLPPMTLVPSGRLTTLVKQAVEFQDRTCPKRDGATEVTSLSKNRLHSALPFPHLNGAYQSWDSVNLLEDHMCSENDGSWALVKTLRDSKSEVFIVQFSNDGQFLASGSADGAIIIYGFGKTSLQSNGNASHENGTYMAVSNGNETNGHVGPTTHAGTGLNHSNGFTHNGSDKSMAVDSDTMHREGEGSDAHSASLTPTLLASSGSLSTSTGLNAPLTMRNSSGASQLFKSTTLPAASHFNLKSKVESIELIKTLKLESVLHIDEAKRGIVSISWSSNNQYLLVGYLAGVAVWNMADGTLLSWIRPQKKGTDLSAAHWLPTIDGYFVSSALDGKIKLVSLDLAIKSYHRRLSKLNETRNSENSKSASSNGHSNGSSSHSSTKMEVVEPAEATTRQETAVSTATINETSALADKPADKIHAVLKSWKIAPINDMIITKDSRYVITVDQEKKIRWTDLEETLIKLRLNGHSNGSSSSSSHLNSSNLMESSSHMGSSNVMGSSSLRNSFSSQTRSFSGLSSSMGARSSKSHHTVTSIVHTLNLTSISQSRDGNYLLVTTTGVGAPFKGLHAVQKLLIYNIHSRELVSELVGQKQSRFVVRASIGGPGDQMVASGSEDSMVQVWNRRNGVSPTVQLKGHTAVVNTVHWCPTTPRLLVSASDDHTVRFWLASK